jgi:hypothetical protein
MRKTKEVLRLCFELGLGQHGPWQGTGGRHLTAEFAPKYRTP